MVSRRSRGGGGGGDRIKAERGRERGLIWTTGGDRARSKWEGAGPGTGTCRPQQNQKFQLTLNPTEMRGQQSGLRRHPGGRTAFVL